MASAFILPQVLPAMKIGWLNDWLSDLMRIKQKDIVLLVYDYDLMLTDDLKIKKNIVADFVDIILPWWEGEIVGHMVGRVPRGFEVYLER